MHCNNAIKFDEIAVKEENLNSLKEEKKWEE